MPQAAPFIVNILIRWSSQDLLEHFRTIEKPQNSPTFLVLALVNSIHLVYTFTHLPTVLNKHVVSANYVYDGM